MNMQSYPRDTDAEVYEAILRCPVTGARDEHLGDYRTLAAAEHACQRALDAWRAARLANNESSMVSPTWAVFRDGRIVSSARYGRMEAV